MEVFVVGNSRSGTHLVSQLLAAGRVCFMFHELHYWERWAQGISRVDREAGSALGAQLIAVQREGVFEHSRGEAYIEEVRRVLESFEGPLTDAEVYRLVLHYETSRSGRRIPIEQTPRNLFYVDLIARAFPDARFIFMERDPRDVLFSQREKWRMRWRGYNEIPRWEALRTWANYHPATLGMLWNAAVRRTEVETARLPAERWRRIKFESLVADPRGTLRSLCAWLGIEFSDEMLDIERWGSSHSERSPSARGVSKDVVGRWRGRLGAADVWWCERICGRRMSQLGYALEAGPRPSVAALAWSLLTWGPKVFLAALLNVGRVRSLGAAVSRRLRGGPRSAVGR